MAVERITIEVERIVNLVLGFGWAKIEEKLVEGAVLLTFRKLVPDIPAAMIRVEIERIVNLVSGFGWVKVEERIADGAVLLTFRKVVAVTEEA